MGCITQLDWLGDTAVFYFPRMDILPLQAGNRSTSVTATNHTGKLTSASIPQLGNDF